MKKEQPDKRSRPDLPKDPFGDFQYRQALAEEMLPMIGRIYRDNVHLLLYGKPLVNLSVSEIMNAHRFVREAENNNFQGTMEKITNRKLKTVDALYSSEDQLEGAKAFSEKRAPVWQGK